MMAYKLRKHTICVLFVVLLINCSNPSDPAPVNPIPTTSLGKCESILTNISLPQTWNYTNRTFMLNGAKFCSDDIKSILLNDMEESVEFISATQIRFMMPTMSSDSVALKIKMKSGSIVDLKKKIAIYPGSGEWKIAQTFPAQGRAFMSSAVIGNKAYFSGGQRTLSNTTTFNYDYPNDLYEYDLITNQWSLYATDSRFSKTTTMAALGNKLYIFSYPSTMLSFDVVTKKFQPLSMTGLSSAYYSYRLFTFNNDLYFYTLEQYKLTIKKYDNSMNQWATVKDAPFYSMWTELNFLFEHKGNFYIGINASSSNIVDLWKFDTTAKTLTRIGSSQFYTVYMLPLRYLFTFKETAYFSETSDASYGPATGAIVKKWTSDLYQYNFILNEWYSFNAQYPIDIPSYRGIVSIQANSRGLAGLVEGASTGNWIYPSNFYEFQPK